MENRFVKVKQEKKMNGDILVTIILLSYNAERYIIEALQSIKMQNHPKIE